MAGTRTAPLFTAAANQRRISLHLIDASGDNSSENLYVAVAAAAADIEAWAAAYAATSQASLWKGEDTLIRQGDEDASNAETDQRNSVKQGINNSFKNVTTRQTFDVRVVAPVPSILQGNQDIPLMTGVLATLITATLALATGYSHQTAQYTERRDRKNNPKIKS